MTDNIRHQIDKNSDIAKEFLIDLIKYPSTPGNEAEAINYCKEKFKDAGCNCSLIPVSNSIKEDPEYSWSDTDMDYNGRSNLIAERGNKDNGRSLILQSHVDVVPARDWKDAFNPIEKDGFIYGRGSGDAKGHVCAIWLTNLVLNELGINLSGLLQNQIVIEEELGGNGALSLIRQGYKADAVVVMESTELNIHPANRGAIWFKIEIEGKPCHMGRKYEGISAIDMSIKVIESLYDYEKWLINESANYKGFERYTNPVQVNIGILNSGEWPAMVAAKSVIEGGVGFLPNRSMEQIKRDVLNCIERIDDKWLKSHYKLTFPKLHNDSYETDYNHPAVLSLKKACDAANLGSEIFGWNVSCDARLYSRIGNMPTIVFGPGTISVAHSDNENIEWKQILDSADALVRFIIDWCGVEK
ncbi:MAG: ArgE/DapE family deacylase [Armatimonadota bacterium]